MGQDLTVKNIETLFVYCNVDHYERIEQHWKSGLVREHSQVKVKVPWDFGGESKPPISICSGDPMQW